GRSPERDGPAVRPVPTPRRPRAARARPRAERRPRVRRGHGRHAHRGRHPRRRADDDREPARGHQPGTRRRRTRRARAVTRVLIVDDDTQLLRALRINLTARGYTVLTAADGRTALRAAAELGPDVVVLDLGLPDLDGTEVITELRTFTQVPVIVLSARTDSSDKVHALDRGADDYVS